MNKVKEKLKKYFSENDIDKLLEKLESKQRSFLINDNYFVKIGKNSNKFFFDNLIKEIDIYKNNQGNQNLPNLIDYYICDDVCLIILEKINGKIEKNVFKNIQKLLKCFLMKIYIIKLES